MCVFCTAGRFFTDEPPGKPKRRGLGSYSSLFPQIQCLERIRNVVGDLCLSGAYQAPSSRLERPWRTRGGGQQPGLCAECPGEASLQKPPELSPEWAGVWQQWHLLFCPSHPIPSLGSGSNTRLIPLCFAVVVQLPSCVPMDCSMPGSSVLHSLSEFDQIHVH